MYLTDTELKKHLKTRDFQRAYMIYGDEKFLVKNDCKLLEKALGVDDPDALGFTVLPYTASLLSIAESVEAMPFLSERNVVKLVDFNIESLTKDEFDTFLDIVETLPETTTFIIAMPTLSFSPKKKSKAKNPKSDKIETLASAVDKIGVVVSEKPYSPYMLEKRLCVWASAGGSKMNPAVAAYLMKRLGSDANLTSLNAEMKKLTAYADGDEITTAMIDELVAKNEEENVYELFSAITAANAEKAMKMLPNLYYRKIDPVYICTVLANAYTEAYALRAGREYGLKNREIVKELSMRTPDWKVEKTLSSIRAIPTSALRKSIDAITAAATTLITTSVNSEIEVEKLVAKLILLTKDQSDD